MVEFKELISKLKKEGIVFEKGLSNAEICRIEDMYGVKFPPDLSLFLNKAFPVSNSFVNWRDTSEENVKRIKSRLNWPLEGIIFDIENNSFWYEGWGKKPNDIDEAIGICKDKFEKVPRLIPICSHRYIPSEPHEEGNPIFSIYQTDIVYYGEDLISYLKVEFRLKKYEAIKLEKIKYIDFWSELQD
ncbi:hypothetical protein [Wukongibacter baidiensis]